VDLNEQPLKLRVSSSLPADAEIALTIQVLNGDVSHADLVVWPQVDADCKNPSAHQTQSIGLALGGTATSRTLTGTLDPLQIHTRFCFQVTFERPLTPAEQSQVATEIGNVKVDQLNQCRPANPSLPSARFTKAIAHALASAPSTASTLAVDPDATAQRLLPTLQRAFDFTSVCKTVLSLAQAKENAVATAKQREADKASALAAVQKLQLSVPALANPEALGADAIRAGEAQVTDPASKAILERYAAALTALTAARTAQDAAVHAYDTDKTFATALASAVAALPSALAAEKGVALASFTSEDTTTAASFVSPVAGVIAAFPIISNHKAGFTTPWLTPYLGASIYLGAVDRVVPVGDLVGSTFWQRFSILIGVLASTPSINGKDVSGPWSLSLVPMGGFGYRLTQYVHADLGVIPFKYSNINPVITDYSWGVALWLGVSVDADLWAVVSGKLGK
jgi:hypothetical protein